MKYKITLQGRTYEVEVERGEAMLLDEYDAVAPVPAAPGRGSRSHACGSGRRPRSRRRSCRRRDERDSPLPGNILDIKVSVGQAVKAGDVLIIIEAMKMENEVAAPCDGVVKQVVTSKGAVVATGDTLLII